jgi:cytosine/adenosine deaminase-related metal-dependent hydrolase
VADENKILARANQFWKKNSKVFMSAAEGFLFAPKPFYGSIKIKDRKIESLSSLRPPKRISQIILPGFISTHIHTVQTHARNTAENLELLNWLKDEIWPFESKLTPKTAYASALTGNARMSSLRNHHHFGYGDH